MRAVVTRVSRASVKVNKATVGKIDRGFLILLAVAPDDSEKDVEFLADKICRVRIFNCGRKSVDNFAVHIVRRFKKPSTWIFEGSKT